MPPANHFSRTPFTHDLYMSMASGFDPNRSLFGPRRIGKTWFLLNDLAPKAETFDHKVVYVDFWDRGPAPLALLLYELDRTLGRKRGISQVIAGARDLAPRVKLSALQAKFELDLTSKPKKLPEDQVLLLDQYLERLADARRPTFMLFDEFQETLRQPDHQRFMAALRASLVRHAGGFATIFTGSSQSRLKKVFTSRKAPFYRYATDLLLPPLGLEFVKHQMVFYPNQAPKIEEADAMAAFERLGRNPDYFQRWMRLRAVSPALSGKEVADQVEVDVAGELGFEKTWLDLKDPHRLVLRMLASGVSDIYSTEAQKFMVGLGVSVPPESSAIQTAFNTLERKDLVDNWEGNRQITDTLFENWVLSRPESDFAI